VNIFNVTTAPSARNMALPSKGLVRTGDAAIDSGGAFLVSELEKRETELRKPLTSLTYSRDVPIKIGGGWVESISAMNVNYGVTGGSGDGPVHAGGSNGIPIVQAGVGKDSFKTHAFALALRIMFVDMQRSSFIGRSLEQLLNEGLRLTYDKHKEQNIYTGLEQYGHTGLLNDPNITAVNVSGTGTGGSTKFKDKTPQQILSDFNDALTTAWADAEYDLSALPNHILLPYEQYNYLLTTPTSALATETILDYIQKNNAARKNGSDLFIGATSWCKGAGAGGTDRMAVYTHSDRFLAFEELVPLARVMTQPNAAQACYDSTYMANLSQLEIFYPQTIHYFDGI